MQCCLVLGYPPQIFCMEQNKNKKLIKKYQTAITAVCLVNTDTQRKEPLICDNPNVSYLYTHVLHRLHKYLNMYVMTELLSLSNTTFFSSFNCFESR